MYMKSINFVQRYFIVALLLCCISQNAFAQQIKVVATFSILGDIVRNVGGDHVDIAVFVKENGDVHAYEPTPQDIVLLSHADIVFANGLHLESWMDKLYAASGSKARRVNVTDGVMTRTMTDHQSEIDPHAWQSVTNVKTYVKNIKEALIDLDPININIYENNAQRYIEQLDALDVWIRNQTRQIKNRTIVTNHDALGYYARDYNFNIVGTVIPAGMTEAADPSAQQTAQLIQTIKQHAIDVIFVESQVNVQLARVLTEETGVRMSEDLYVDALGDHYSDAADYLSMMRHNTMIFIKYLSEKKQQEP